MIEMVIAIGFAISTVSSLLYIYFKEKKRKKIEKEENNKRVNKMKEDIVFFIEQLQHAESLNDIYILHLKIWGSGIQHANFGPDVHGIFRTSDILKMEKSEIILGNINGLWNKPLTFWETYDNAEDVRVITNKYRNHLISNLKFLYKKLERDGKI